MISPNDISLAQCALVEEARTEMREAELAQRLSALTREPPVLCGYTPTINQPFTPRDSRLTTKINYDITQ